MTYETMSGLGDTLITDSCSIPQWEVLGPLFLLQGIVSVITGNHHSICVLTSKENTICSLDYQETMGLISNLSLKYKATQ